MTPEEFKAVVTSVYVGNTFHIRFMVHIEPGLHSLALDAVMPVRCRDTGVFREGLAGSVRATVWFTWDLLERLSTKDLVVRLRDLVQGLLLHELDESFYVNGHRVYDPHLTAEQRPAVAMALAEPRPLPWVQGG